MYKASFLWYFYICLLLNIKIKQVLTLIEFILRKRFLTCLFENENICIHFLVNGEVAIASEYPYTTTSHWSCGNDNCLWLIYKFSPAVHTA